MTHQINSKESELQHLLTDERERCNQYKQLYQSLKEEHSKVRDELTLVHQQLKEAVSKNNLMRETKDNCIKKLEEQLREKQKEISQLSEEVQSYDPKKIRDNVLDEARKHYEAKIKEHLVDADKMKEQFVNLRYEYAVLKCKLESRDSEYSHAVERMKVQHLSEVEQLQNKMESLEKEKISPNDSIVMDLTAAKHDILELNAKLRGLLAECEELRAKNENLTLQLNSTNRTHSKQFADSLSNIRALESEKQKALMQKEILEKELSSLQEQKRIINNDLQSSRREILTLTSKLEECEHKCRMMIMDLQVENDRLRNEYQSEREQLIDEITRIKSELTDVTLELDHTHQIIMSKEQEWQQNSMIARQQLWKQSSEFQVEKERNEKKFQELKNQKDQFISQLNHEVQVLQQDLQICSESKLEIEKELLAAKEKFENTLKDTDASAIEMLSKQNLEYEQQIHALKEQISRLKSNSNIFLEEKDRLLSEVLSRRRTDQELEEGREILELKLNWEQQKHQFHQRTMDLESQLKEVKNASVAEKKEQELKIQRYLRHVNKLKDKLEILKVKNEDLENQKESFEKNVPFEIHMQVKNKLTELQRRLEEYRLIVAAEPHFSGCTKSSATVSDKLLTDIKNLQLRLPFTEDLQEYEVIKHVRDKHAVKPKKISHLKRRSFKLRNRELPSKSISPAITSSSDLESENL